MVPDSKETHNPKKEMHILLWPLNSVSAGRGIFSPPSSAFLLDPILFERSFVPQAQFEIIH